MKYDPDLELQYDSKEEYCHTEKTKKYITVNCKSHMNQGPEKNFLTCEPN